MRAVIFDFDGTLADTLPVIFKSFQRIFLEGNEQDVSTEEIISMFGPTEEEIIRKAFSDPVHADLAVERFFDYYEAEHAHMVERRSEVIELLQEIKRKGWKLAVVTGKGQRSLAISLKALQMESFFDLIITGDDVQESKPHPEGIHKALALLGVTAEEALFLGDSEADMEAGQRAGVRTIGVQWLSVSQTEQFHSKPEAVFTRFEELSAYLTTL
jgi:pyrophosphatase PpaX